MIDKDVQHCSKCGVETDDSNDLHCRKILVAEVKHLLLIGKTTEAEDLVSRSQGNDEWEKWKMGMFRRFVLEALQRGEQLRREEAERLEEERTARIIEILAPAQSLLNNGNFLEADKFVLEKHPELLKEYERKKFECVKTDLCNLEKELKEKEGYFDSEKATVLSTTSKNILVQARAGSGKTTTIALRVRQLIKFYGARPDEILVLAFNNAAADEFRGRINKYCGDEVATESNTLTFHALAKRIANTGKCQLVDEKSHGEEHDRHGEDKNSQIDFVRKCFNEVENKDRGLIRELFYLFLKVASERIKGAFRNDSEYYLYLRNQEYTTIAGEFVKSVGEKYIADFLFEHKISKDGKEIEYAYERNVKKPLNIKYSYNPDFSLFYIENRQKEQLQAVIEYFGFTENNPGYPGFFDTEEESRKYLNESDKKRKLFSDVNICFVEMSADDFEQIKTDPSLDNEQARNQFEKIIRQRLSEKGFDISNRLSEKEILGKIPKVERRKKKLVRQVTQFINKAQKLSYSPDKVREISKAEKVNANLSKRNEYFIRIACRVYDEYRSRLEEESSTDFDGLFIDAITKIKKEGIDCKIAPYYGEKKIGDIKHILIDEYQDFSELFYQLIDEIRNVNPSIYFFCVGDDWQAINGFAGSDLKFFEMFETKYFKGGSRVHLLTNYRSNKDIVLHSNILMVGLGPWGEPEKGKPNGAVYLSELLRVELRNDQEHINEYDKDKRYVDAACALLGKEDTNKSIPLELARYLKTVEYIISNKVDSKKPVCLLFRANKIHGVPMSKFAEKIRKLCPERPNTLMVDGKDVLAIDYSTAHSFKGKESDVVIIVGANRRSFPKFHPDNELMEVLGVTMQKVRDEEQRLFYVAITRAKEELYLVYNEKIGVSDFIFPERWQYLPVVNCDSGILPF
ncbi:MAG: UvrD-helicase domain-containing protein [Patescibacteria group bacterium]